jgi:hypothetical protein
MLNLPTEIPDGFMGTSAAVGLVSPPGEPTRTAVPLWSVTRDTKDESAEASNFDVALMALTEIDAPHVEVRREMNWACGWIDTIWVVPQAQGFTPAWIMACRMLLALMVSPVLDEENLAERERLAFETWFDDAITYVLPSYEHDTSEQVSLIAALAKDVLVETSDYAEVIGMDTDQLSGFWSAARDAVFEQLGHEYLTAQLPGQGALL